MKALLRILGVLVWLVVTFLLVGLMLPGELAVERSTTIAASPGKVYPLVVDLQRWPDWQAWNKEMDPTVTYKFSQPSAGAGAWYEWNGETLSTGKVAITEVDPDRSIAYTVAFADMTPCPGEMRFESADDGRATRVDWTFRCDLGFNPIGRYFGLYLNGALANDFDTGLANLKRLAESSPAPPSGSAASPATAAPPTATPGTEVPASEVPASETPAAETPPTETPAAESPAAVVPGEASDAVAAPAEPATPEATPAPATVEASEN